VSVSHFANLPAEHQTLEALVAVLEREQQALIHADTDTLTALLAEKQPLVNQMNTYGAARNKALAAAGLAADDTGMRAALAQAADAQAEAHWNRLLELTARAKELNRVNGVLINKQLTHTQGAINALNPQGSGNAVYGPDGQSQAGFGNRRGIVG
jgi:flagella synthesis protein FlgN